MGTVYLLHFLEPIGNPANPRAMAQHYIGWAAVAAELQAGSRAHDVVGRFGGTGIFASVSNLTHEGAIKFLNGYRRNSVRANLDQAVGDGAVVAVAAGGLPLTSTAGVQYRIDTPHVVLARAVQRHPVQLVHQGDHVWIADVG